MDKREIHDLDIKVKLTLEYLNNGGIEEIQDLSLLEDFAKIKLGLDGKVDPESLSSSVKRFMLIIYGFHLKPPLFDPESESEYKSTLQKSNCFVQKNIDTIEQFDAIYDEYKKKTETIFRGQKEAKWRLYSTLQRQWLKDKLFETENYQALIQRMVDSGKLEYGAKIKDVLQTNHIDTENPISILGYLQHHGCPTPLLDWSNQFRNALYFAIDELTPNIGTIEIEDYFSVYHIEEKYLKGSNLRAIISSGFDEMEEPQLQRQISIYSNGDEETRKEMQEEFAGMRIFDRSRIDGLGLVSHMTKVEHLMSFPIAYFSDKDKESGILFSINNNKNILNQSGVFTWNADPSKPIELIGDEQFKKGKSIGDAKNYHFCSCFNIHKKLADYIRKRLEEDGITKDFIYPTLNENAWKIYDKNKIKTSNRFQYFSS